MIHLFVGLSLSVGNPTANPAETDLNSTKTYAVIVGVLQWAGNRIPGFPTKNRKDEELYETLRSRGVPAENMALLLDEQATYSGVQRAVRQVGGRAASDATLIVYYCGHGSPCAGGDVCLANYDLIPRFPERTGLRVSDLVAMVRASFKGKRVAFLADCCFSGGLASAAEALSKAGFETASLTSSDDTMVSTENWTFTQTVIDALKGDTFADANADGTVTLGELADEVKGAMRALERQRSGYAAFGIPSGFRLTTGVKPVAVADGSFRVGEYALVNNRPGRVVAVNGDRRTVQFYEYTEKRRVQVPADKLAAIPAKWENRLVIERAEIEVEWNGRWYPATILKKDGERTRIHYVGFETNWDEWVTKERIRPLK
jgi:hypothetical protein